MAKKNGGIKQIWHYLQTIGLQVVVSIVQWVMNGLRTMGSLVHGIYHALERLRRGQRRFLALALATLLIVLNLLAPAQAQFVWGPPNTWNVVPNPPPVFPFPATLPKLNAITTQTFPVSVNGVPFLDIRMTIDDTLVPGGVLEGFRDGEPPQSAAAGSPNTGGYAVGDPRLRNLWTRINTTGVGQGVGLTLEFFRPGTPTPFPINVSGLEILDIDRSNLAGTDWQDEVEVSGLNGAVPVIPTVAPAVGVVTPSWAQAPVGNTVVVTGNSDGPNNTNIGTAVISFPTNRVTSVRLVYREGLDSIADPSAHAISLLGPIDFALPDLTLTKTPAAATVSRGSNTTYTLRASNVAAGPNAGFTYGTITITDTLPAGLTFVSGTGTNWACNAVGQVVTCNYTGADIAPGASAPDVTLTVTVGGAGLTYTNTSTVTTPGDSNNTNNTGNATITVLAPDLTIVKTAVAPPFAQGGNGSYTLQVNNVAVGANAGPTTGAVTITDTLPAGLTFVSGTGTNWTCNAVGQAVTCTYAGAPIAAGAAAPPVTLTVGVGNAANYTNTSTVNTPGDSNPGNNTSTAVVPTSALAPDLTIVKTAVAPPFAQGGNGSYTLQVNNVAVGANAGPTTGAVTITDTLPAGLTFVSGTGTNWTCNAVGQAVTCTYAGAPIAAGAAAPPVTLTVGVGNAANYTNTATVNTPGDSNPGNNSDPETVATTALAPDLTIVKTAVGAPFAQGGNGSYTLQVNNVAAGANAGPTTGAVTITDTLPAGLTFVSGTGTNWTCNAVGQAVTCTYAGAPIAAGAAAPPVTLTVGVGNAANYTNTSTVNTPGDSNPGNNTSTAVVPTVPPTTPNVLLVKRITRINSTDIAGFVDDPGTTDDNNPRWPDPATYLRGARTANNASPGDEVEYTIYFLSAGTGNVTNFRICDVLRPNLSFSPIAFNGLPGDGGLAADQGIALSLSTTAFSATPTNGLTNISDAPDRGLFISPGAAVPPTCNSVNPNTNGIVVVDVAQAPAALPPATNPNTVPNSYGFIRFRARVQ